MPAAKIRLPSPHSGGQDKFVHWNTEETTAQVLVAPAGTKVGKALWVKEIIATPLGFKTVENLKIGDFVFSEYGQPIKITDVTPVMHGHDCYELVFSDDTKVIADAGHLWVTQTHNERKNIARAIKSQSKPTIRTTDQIAKTLIKSIGDQNRYNHTVDNLAQPLLYPRKDLPIHPYLLGIWLGDGTALNGKITNPDDEILKFINALGYETNKLTSADYCYNVVGLAKKLRINGLIENKHVPRQYLESSPEQRLNLLQGLMDSDGCIGERGDSCFDNTNLALADAVAELAQSFGIKVYRSIKKAYLNGERKKDCYRVWFVTDIPVFKLSRKRKRLRKVNLKAKRRSVVAVNKIDSVPVKCISVDSPSKMFLVGKACIPTHNSFGSALWLAKEVLINPKMFSVWIAPTYGKSKIGYRYLKAMLDIPEVAKCTDGRLEISLANGSFIKFLHGKDAEVTIEGEAVDRFIIDETSKLDKQVWFSLFTTITQTGGLGIITGTPRGFNWYYDVYQKALSGDPFFTHLTLRTIDNPYNDPAAIERAKRLLPKMLYEQYYLAKFTSASTIFGNMDNVWDDSIELPETTSLRFWVHPDASRRAKEVHHGIDLAKKRDYTVIFSTNYEGQVVGFVRFKNVPYPQQAKRIQNYMQKYFAHTEDNFIRFDVTGIGEAVGDLIYDLEIDASITPVTFTNASKADMVTRLTQAIEQGWLKAPRIKVWEHEMASYEVKVTKSGLHSYNATDGEHDDTVCAAMLSVTGAYQSSMSLEAETMLEETGEAFGGMIDNDKIYEFDDFFDDYDKNGEEDFELEGTYG
jgi:hypothetical protein